jgi:Ca2+/H+ antiporter, TMEM165/GDT1 family
VVFVAELGDKSQLMALAFATRYRALPVLAGITLATATLLGLSVVVGVVLKSALPTRPISIVAGLVFLAFALWTVRGDDEADDEAVDLARGGRSVMLGVAGAFFLSELGDKTMLATITLATTEGALGTWLGATTGMVAADALAIVIGRQLGERLPARAIRLGAAAAFLVFGALLLYDGVRG